MVCYVALGLDVVHQLCPCRLLIILQHGRCGALRQTGLISTLEDLNETLIIEHMHEAVQSALNLI